MESNFNETMTNIYHKYFKESAIKFSKGCLGNDTYFIHCYLANNELEVAHRYFDNDMFHIMLEFEILGNNNYVLESVMNNYIIKPQDKYLYCSSRKVSFRKTTGDINKIYDTFDKFIKKLYESVKNEQEVHDNYKQILTEKISL